MESFFFDIFLSSLQSTARFERSYNTKYIGRLQYMRHASQLFATIAANGKILGLASTGTPYIYDPSSSHRALERNME